MKWKGNVIKCSKDSHIFPSDYVYFCCSKITQSYQNQTSQLITKRAGRIPKRMWKRQEKKTDGDHEEFQTIKLISVFGSTENSSLMYVVYKRMWHN